jgi:hypothetical protein
MIGWWGFQIVEPPRASSGTLAIKNARRVRIVPSHRPRSPPGPQRTAAGSQKATPATYGAGPAEATASPGEPISTRIDHGTESGYDFSHYLGRHSMQELGQPI